LERGFFHLFDYFSKVQNKLYQIALSLIPKIGPIKAKTLISHIGSAEQVFKEDKNTLGKVTGVGSYFLKDFDPKKLLLRAERELTFIEKNNIECLYYKDERYPSKLKEAMDSPIVLYTKGNIDFSRKNVAIVGTRKATAYGKSLTKQFIADLKDHNVNVVSGLAYGIDIEAHKAALNNNIPTVGVFARGLDSIYPAPHRPIANEMLDTGGWVTEFLSETPGDASFFVKRNRIVAGICDTTVVVESAQKGGSLITAGLANDYNRDVFAFPGDITREYSKGCNMLIQKNRAHLLTSAQDMIDILGWQTPLKQNVFQTNLFLELSEDEQKVIDILKDKGALHVDPLTNLANMSISVMSVNLFNLEMKGAIRALAGKRYEVV
jgi:DNA processing protein